MSELQFKVNEERCTRCGMCVRECPMSIITQKDRAFPQISKDNEAMCIGCQHCLAVCPTGAISILGRDPAKSLPVTKTSRPTYETMDFFVRSRRSVRHYKKENVPKEKIRELLQTVANVPTGVNSQGLRFRVIDDMDQLDCFRTKIMNAMKDVYDRKAFPPSMAYLEVLVPQYFEQGVDFMFRGAPHLLIVSASPNTMCVTENVPIALSYFELLAQSAGLGTVWCGLVKMGLETVPALKDEIGLPADEHYYPMLFGYPAISFARTVQRDDGAEIIPIRVKL